MIGWRSGLMRERRLKNRGFRKTNHGGPSSAFGIFVIILSGIAFSSALGGNVQARTTVHIVSGDEQSQLKSLNEKGDLQFTLPLYQQNGIHYFSAGIGLEERQVAYPPFPLKIVLVSGPRAYVSSVKISIQDHNGSMILDIPPDQVGGPWVFVNLPPGTYSIIGKSGKAPVVKKTVTLPKHKTTQVILRWPTGE